VQGDLQNIAACAGVTSASSQFPSWTWNQVTFGESNAVYAIPQDTGPLGLVYRSDLFKRYGLTVPTTWDQFKADADKLKTEDPNAYLTNDASDPNWLAGMSWQNGAHWFSLSGSTWNVSIDGSQSQAVAAYWQQLTDANELAPVADWSTAWEKDLANGTILSWPTAAWGTALLKEYAPGTSGDWAVAPLPQWSASSASDGNWGGSTTTVFTGSKHPYEASEFALWLNTNPTAYNMLVSSAGLYPAANALQGLSALQTKDPYFGGQAVFDVFSAAEKQVNPSFLWGPTMTLTLSEMQDAINAANNKQGTLTGALSTGQSKTIADMRQQGIAVAQ
jgi:multiple sugar transport system substrate-binding protein